MSGTMWKCYGTQFEKHLEDFCAHILKDWDRSKPLKIEYRQYRSQRTFSQNALFHVWVREFVAFLAKINVQEVPEKAVEDAKGSLKKSYYLETGHTFVVRKSVDLLTGKASLKTRSSAEYETGDMFAFMEWIQVLAANKGLILEAKGEYEQLKPRQAA